MLNCKWYDGLNFENLKFTKSDLAVSKVNVQNLFEYAQKCYDHGSQKVMNDDKDNRFKKFISHGTYSDKLSTYMILIQDYGLYSLLYLLELSESIQVGNRRLLTNDLQSICELFISNVMPKHRKLKHFITQPFLPFLCEYFTANNKNLKNNYNFDLMVKVASLTSLNTDRFKYILANIYFEHVLKVDVYLPFIQKIIALTEDPVKNIQFIAIKTLSTLLINIPENEILIMEALVNKLTYPDTQVFGLTSSCLSNILAFHPNMIYYLFEQLKTLINTKILRLVCRKSSILTAPSKTKDIKSDPKMIRRRKISKKETSNQNKLERKFNKYDQIFVSLITFLRKCLTNYFFRAKKSSISTLNKELENKFTLEVLEFYFSLFQQLAPHHEYLSPKILNSIFLGINKLAPNLKVEGVSSSLSQEIDTLFALADKSNLKTKFQILHFIHQIFVGPQMILLKSDILIEGEQSISTKFFEKLYAVLNNEPTLFHSQSCSKFIKLIHTCLTHDENIDRIRKFVYTLLDKSLNLTSVEYTIECIQCAFHIMYTLQHDKGISLLLPTSDIPLELHGEEQNNTGYKRKFSKIIDPFNIGSQIKSTVPREKKRKNPNEMKINDLQDTAYMSESGQFYQIYALIDHYHPTVSLIARNFVEGRPPILLVSTRTTADGKNNNNKSLKAETTLNSENNPDLRVKNPYSLAHFLEGFIRKKPKIDHTTLL